MVSTTGTAIQADCKERLSLEHCGVDRVGRSWFSAKATVDNSPKLYRLY